MSETTTDSSEAAKFGVDGDRCSSGGGGIEARIFKRNCRWINGKLTDLKSETFADFQLNALQSSSEQT